MCLLPPLLLLPRNICSSSLPRILRENLIRIGIRRRAVKELRSALASLALCAHTMFPEIKTLAEHLSRKDCLDRAAGHSVFLKGPRCALRCCATADFLGPISPCLGRSVGSATSYNEPVIIGTAKQERARQPLHPTRSVSRSRSYLLPNRIIGETWLVVA